jgi:diguanylate cyclase (GGDEF)-like protein/PAS domain S-box-containing protein
MPSPPDIPAAPDPRLQDPGTIQLSETQLRQSIFTATLMGLLLPPFIGGTLMGLAGFYPLPEFYLVFTDISGPYVAIMAMLGLWIARHIIDFTIGLTQLAPEVAQVKAKRTLSRLPWYLLLSLTFYSMLGVLSADLSLERMGYQTYDLRGHLYNQFGLVPVVLITAFPIFFYLIDRLGRYLGPRGICVVAIPLWLRLTILGLFTPLLIDSLLISYFANQTGYFTLTTLALWLSLLMLAGAGTWLAWHSQRQSIAPMQHFFTATDDFLAEAALSSLKPLSLDELGVLAAHLEINLRRQHDLTGKLHHAQSLASAIIDNAGVLVVVLDHEGRIQRFNRASEALSGYDLEEVQGHFPWDILLPAEEAETIHRQAFERVAQAAQDTTTHYTNYWVCKDGRRRLIEWFNSLILDDAGHMELMVSVGIDITRQQELEEERARSELRYRTLFEQARDGILIVDPVTQRFTEFNSVAHEQLGYSGEEFRQLGIGDIEVIESPEETMRHVEKVQSQGWDNFETIHRCKDGSLRNVRVVVQQLTLDNKPLLQCSFQDITERKQTEESLRLYANVIEHSGEAIMITDQQNRIVAINPSLTELTGYTLEDLRGKDPRILSSGHTTRETYESMWQSLRESDYWQGELWDRRKDGSAYPKWAAISVIRNDKGEATNYIASFTDISERKAAEERIHQLAHHDALTGLFNRFSLESRLEQALLSARRENGQLTVMFIDMDRFKIINDTLGHHAGDALLVEVAQRLQVSVRESDIVARLGGDEFIIVLTNMAAGMAAAPIATSLIQTLGRPYQIEGKTVHSTPSIGISLFPADGEDVDTLLKNADTAMYHAKEQGRNNYQFFTEAMNAQVAARLELENELREAVAKGQFELHYQPQIHAGDGRLRGLEALVRWRHPEKGIIPPDSFIPIAEETGLISAIGEWVLAEACRQKAAWRKQGQRIGRIAVNISTYQLHSSNLVEQVRNNMHRYGLSAGELELEITESGAMENPELAAQQLRALRELGIEIAIDDFGTGYSSLSYLKRLPIQRLKIDRSFVMDIEHDASDAAICKAIISMARSLELGVVAEGVETREQHDFLSNLGCELLQGYYYSRPVPAEELVHFIERGYPGTPPTSTPRHH